MLANEMQVLCYQALKAELGLLIYTPDPIEFRKTFYKVRSEARSLGNSDFDVLSVQFRSEDPNHVKLVKKGA